MLPVLLSLNTCFLLALPMIEARTSSSSSVGSTTPSLHAASVLPGRAPSPNWNLSEDEAANPFLHAAALLSLAAMIHTWSLHEATSSLSLPAGEPTSHPISDSAFDDPESPFSDSAPSPEFLTPGSGATSYGTAHGSPASPADPFEGWEGPTDPPASSPSFVPSNDTEPEPLPVSQIPIEALTEVIPLHPHTNYFLRCWIGPMDVSPVFPNPGDCLSALGLLLHGEKDTAPMMFGQRTGFRVPHRWVWNTCGIVIQMVGAETTMTTSFEHIANVVRLIMEHCLDYGTDHRGGLFKLGEMYITLSGRVPGGEGEQDCAIGSHSYRAHACA